MATAIIIHKNVIVIGRGFISLVLVKDKKETSVKVSRGREKSMTEVLHFTGFIKGVAYKTYLAEKEKLKAIKLENFDANTSPSYGIIDSDGTKVSYSKWVSPKRTRSYPFARIYNTYNFSKVITIIPVLKDEGSDGDRDLIQYSTFSWMNLLNIYIVLAYYDGAEKSYKKDQENKNKLTKQQFNNDFIKAQIEEILTYHQSALHWNRSLLENKFAQTFEKALDSYEKISTETNVKIHSSQIARKTLKKIQEDFEEFKNISHKASQSASKREALVSHELEYLVDGKKSTFSITNYLGGVYYLTPDEVIDEIDKNNRYIIQESKNTSESNFPKLPDIQDGLFKLILFSNIHELKLNDQIVNFVTKLKLTGKNVNDSLVLPAATEVLEVFLEKNTSNFSKTEKTIIRKLVLEVGKNQNLLIEISGNYKNEKK